ncbi:MAG: hypothetical protein E7660_07970 [Ruminococcaceae bacterium]|nr:hypothetical protein [Oscillospiraceae bacterium]
MKSFIRFALCFVCIVISACILSSCVLSDALLNALGFDTHDYESESVITYHASDSDVALQLAEMVKILSVNNPMVPEFENTGDAVSECRDAILNYMLCTSFAKYTGNPDLINKAAAEYPQFQLLSIIPGEDYEDFVYTYFGGNTKLSHKSSTLFTYLEKVQAYTALTVPVEYKVNINILSCEETEKTYRISFQNTLDEVTSPVYKALIIKREDGSCYFKKLETAK